MFRNYFTIAWRNLKNNLLFSSLNVIGLSIGMAACLVTALFAYQEYTYETHHEKADRIYRVVNRQIEGTKSTYLALTQGTLSPEVLKTFPEVENAARLGFMLASMSVEGKEPEGIKVTAVDKTFFSIFTIPFKIAPHGDVITDDGILISEYAANRIFGTKNPIGETISLGNDIHLKVLGVFENFPNTSHLSTQFIISFSWIEKTEAHAASWSFNSYYNYLLMPEEFDAQAFNFKLNEFVHRFTPPGWKSFEYFLQPITKINLSPGYVANPRGSIGKTLINGFVMVSFIILLLASFNYMNLATARSARRALEVGIRKVVGAVRGQLIRQFLIESLILCVIGFLLAILWADIGLQFFNAFTGFGLTLVTFFGNPKLLGYIILLLLVIAVVSGGYPAFFLSRFVPSAVLKGQRSSDSGRRWRKGLVIFQFSLTGLLVVLVIMVLRQTNYMREKDLGFNKKGIIVFYGDRNTDISLESFKDEMMKISGVKLMTSATSIPGTRMNTTDLWENGKPQGESVKAIWVYSDHDYIPTLELTLIAGRNFNSNGTDARAGAIINENAAAVLGWTPEEAIGKKILGFSFSDSIPGEIVGVIKDFHISPLRKEIIPLVIAYSKTSNNYLLRVEGTNLNQIPEQVDKIGTKHTHGDKVESQFLEEVLEENYGAEIKTGQMLTFFTFLAILIGCSGLYALSAFEGEQRTKELGIRKIMGASTRQLLFILSRDFLKLIVISLFLAMPMSYFLGNLWLRLFPYRIAWSAEIFLLAAGFVLSLGWLTILTQAVKASRMNPVDALRYE